MKRIMAFMTALLLLLFAGVTASAESAAETNRRLGYFENTRTVLLIPASYRGQGDFAAAYVNKSMKEIFRYPYYRLIDDTSYEGKPISPALLPEIQKQSGADIVVLPQVALWQQYIVRRSLFDFGDNIISTRAIVDIYTIKNGENKARQDRGTYFEIEDEGFVRNEYIMDDIMKQIQKSFPYKRVPTDIPNNLSGNNQPDSTPKTGMNY